MLVKLRVENYPLSWKCEDVKSATGFQIKARTVGRRVWGKEIGVAQWALESQGGELLLISLEETGARVHQRFQPPEGYDSPWHSECVSRAQQVAEWYEAQAFNAVLDLFSIGREALPLDLAVPPAR